MYNEKQSSLSLLMFANPLNESMKNEEIEKQEEGERERESDTETS